MTPAEQTALTSELSVDFVREHGKERFYAVHLQQRSGDRHRIGTAILKGDEWRHRLPGTVGGTTIYDNVDDVVCFLLDAYDFRWRVAARFIDQGHASTCAHDLAYGRGAGCGCER